jgi:formylglycine-generating enzyme required for sulfatase activity
LKAEPNSELNLTNRVASLTLKTLSSRDFYWAKALSVTSNGVVATTDCVRVTWTGKPASTGNYGAVIGVQDNAPQWLHQFKPQLDEHGLYVNLLIKGITLKLRYIPSGSFMMGSPESEVERRNNEAQHPVTLTQGFWLGETTVSQLLWEVVMGNNPSHFRARGNEMLSVERVSWDDCQQFCRRANELELGFAFTLQLKPSGSMLAGQQLTTNQVNYNGIYLYNNGEKGEYRKVTVAISEFTVNDWGLIQMHGNGAKMFGETRPYKLRLIL